MHAFNEPITIEGAGVGPTVALVALTHGNETIGLDIFDNLLEKQDIKSLLKRGKILFICSNIQAHKSFVKQNNPMKFRFINHDMNRIWDDSYVEDSYEYLRREELKKLLEPVDIVLDIHSVSKGGDILGISGESNYKNCISFMDVEKILIEKANIPSMRNWLERNGKIAFGIEAGNHTSKNGLPYAIRTILNLLKTYNLLDKEVKEFCLPSPEVLEFLEELRPITRNFHYAHDYNNWDQVLAGEIYAIDTDHSFFHDYTGDIRIGLVQKEIQFGRGAGFLFRKIIQS